MDFMLFHDCLPQAWNDRVGQGITPGFFLDIFLTSIGQADTRLVGQFGKKPHR